MRYALPVLAAALLRSAAALAGTTQPAAPLAGPTKVSLHIDADSVATATKQISEQLGAPLGRQMMMGMMGGMRNTGEKKRPIRFDADDQPLAKAVGDMLQAAGLSVYGGGMLAVRDVPPLRVMHLTPTTSLVVTQTSVMANVYLRSQQQPSYSYAVQLNLITDPSMKIVACAQQAVVDTLDYDGTPQQGTRYYSQSLQQLSLSPLPIWGSSLNFESMKPATTVKRLTGHVRCWTIVEEATVDISVADISAGQPIKGDGLTASVESNDTGRGSTMTLKLTGPAAELYTGPNNGMSFMRDAVQALDADDKPLQVNAQPLQPDNGSLVTRLFLQGPAGDDFMERLAKLHVRLPTKLRAVDVPFEITDLPLP